jgi:hypothetical protein
VRSDNPFTSFPHCSFAYSALACLRMGMSGSASFPAENGHPFDTYVSEIGESLSSLLWTRSVKILYQHDIALHGIYARIYEPASIW